MRLNNIEKLIVSVVVCQIAGLIPAVFVYRPFPSWYNNLAKPSFTPPGWVFAVVWPALFLLMGLAAYLVWSTAMNSDGKNIAMLFFWLQLFINMLWSFIFFLMHSPLLAFLELMVLWVAIVLTIGKFYRVSKAAAWLMVPYLLWVTFAGVMNFAVVIMNPLRIFV